MGLWTSHTGTITGDGQTPCSPQTHWTRIHTLTSHWRFVHKRKREKQGLQPPDRHRWCFSPIPRPCQVHKAPGPPHLQLLEFLARQKALASRLQQDDAVRHQLLPLLLQPGDHARFEEDLEGEKAAGDFAATESDCLKWEGLPLRPQFS